MANPYRGDKTVRLGDEARDTVTGFRGIVTAHTRWLNNCDRYTLQPAADKRSKVPNSESFDAPNLERVNGGVGEAIAVIRPKDPVDLADEVKDRLTGASGIVVAHTIWLNGCSRLMIQPKALDAEGRPAALVTVDEKDARIIKRAKPVAQVKTGGPRPSPRMP